MQLEELFYYSEQHYLEDIPEHEHEPVDFSGTEDKICMICGLREGEE